MLYALDPLLVDDIGRDEVIVVLIKTVATFARVGSSPICDL